LTDIEADLMCRVQRLAVLHPTTAHDKRPEESR
jgi:hypothetical protein